MILFFKRPHNLARFSGIIALILVAATAILATSCNRRGDMITGDDFSVTCRFDMGELNTTRLALLVLDNDYGGKLRLIDSTMVVHGFAHFEGQIERPATAILKIDDDNIIYFVLEKGTTTIDVRSDKLIIASGPLNHQYMQYLNRRASIESERSQLWQDYRQLCLTPPVDPAKERRMNERDSLLADSLQRLTIKTINRGNAASRIVFERYVNTLSPSSLQQLETFK